MIVRNKYENESNRKLNHYNDVKVLDYLKRILYNLDTPTVLLRCANVAPTKICH